MVAITSLADGWVRLRVEPSTLAQYELVDPRDGPWPQRMLRRLWARPARDPRQHDRLFQNGGALLVPFACQPYTRRPPTRPERRRLERARRSLLRALGFHRANPASWFFLGFAYRYLGRLPDALAAHHMAYALDHTNVDIGRELALSYIAVGNSDAAVRVSEEVVARNPPEAGLLSNLALALLIAGRDADALRTVERALAMDPEDPVTGELRARIAAVMDGSAVRPSCWPEPRGRA